MITMEMVKGWESNKVEIHFKEEDIRIAKIIEVNSLGEKGNNERIPFSFILLTNMTDAYYEQGTFKVVIHEGMEEYLFMVPIGVDSESHGMRYEVVFN